jgi:polyribonucleotide nucleotidyltransferase
MIREIEENTGATLDIEDEGVVIIGAADGEALAAAKELVTQIAFPPEVELGTEYEGEVVNITKFGAFINLLPGRDGLLHISKIGGGRRVERVEDEMELGDKVKVVVREIDDRGKVSLDLPGSEVGGDGGDRDSGRRDSRGDGAKGDGGRGDGGGRRQGGRSDRKPRGDRDRNRDRGKQDSGGAKSDRKVVSFEDEFESGL